MHKYRVKARVTFVYKVEAGSKAEAISYLVEDYFFD